MLSSDKKFFFESAKVYRLRVNPNPTLFDSREASEPYSRGQWDSALKATPHSPKGDVSYVRALEPTARSGAHGFRSRRPRSLLTVLNYCRIRVVRPAGRFSSG